MNATAALALRAFLIAAVVTFTLLGVVNAATGLWSDTVVSAVQAINLGTVQFAAAPYPPGDVPEEYATGTGEHLAEGTPLAVTLPGQDIIQVLDHPTMWRFRAGGYAQGITGMTYDISYPDATDGSVLAGSTMRVFKASNGDCSAVPEDQPSLTGIVLQEAGTNMAGDLITDEWCVSIVWNYDPDGYHLNTVSASGTADDSRQVFAFAQLGAHIAFPASLDPLGIHQNTVFAQGTGEDGTISRDNATFAALIFPDPSKEPAIPITLTPHVSNANPHFPAVDP
jgi:hypothetical protein